MGDTEAEAEERTEELALAHLSGGGRGKTLKACRSHHCAEVEAGRVCDPATTGWQKVVRKQ